MDSLLRCPFCGGEVYVAKVEPRLYRPSCNHPYSVVCYNCDLFFGYDEDYGGEFDTESEAIEAWNRRAERTVKVVDHKYRIGISLNIVGEPKICHEYLCDACKKKVLSGDDYCSHCGAKLDWSEG